MVHAEPWMSIFDKPRLDASCLRVDQTPPDTDLLIFSVIELLYLCAIVHLCYKSQLAPRQVTEKILQTWKVETESNFSSGSQQIYAVHLLAHVSSLFICEYLIYWQA